MQQIFGPNIKVGCKESVPRIADKIEEAMHKKKVSASKAWCGLTDILRFQIFCRTPDDVKEVFQKMLSEPYTCQIMRLKPRFDTFLKDMIINFNFLGYVIAEM
jgi:hypothetical protein